LLTRARGLSPPGLPPGFLVWNSPISTPLGGGRAWAIVCTVGVLRCFNGRQRRDRGRGNGLCRNSRKQAGKHTITQTHCTQATKQANKQTSNQTNKHTNKETNKHTTKHKQPNKHSKSYTGVHRGTHTTIPLCLHAGPTTSGQFWEYGYDVQTKAAWRKRSKADSSQKLKCLMTVSTGYPVHARVSRCMHRGARQYTGDLILQCRDTPMLLA
jgi:hypothetical protein